MNTHKERYHPLFIEPVAIRNRIWLGERTERIRDIGGAGPANVEVQLTESEGNVHTTTGYLANEPAQRGEIKLPESGTAPVSPRAVARPYIVRKAVCKCTP